MDKPRGVRGPYEKGVRRRREIIESAARVFATHGYNSGSMRQIAEEVGVTPTALSRHFQNKEGLLQAVLEYWDEGTDSRIPAGLTGLEHFRAMQDTIEYNRGDRGLVELFLTLSAEASDPNHPAADFIRKRYDRIVAAAAARLQEARDIGEVQWMSEEQMLQEVRVLYAVMDGIQLQWLLDPTIDTAETFRRALHNTFASWSAKQPDGPDNDGATTS